MSFAASGVNCAVATPLNADFTPDHGRFAAHCNWLLGQGCHGLALLGTTGEANSFSVGERKAILEAALEAGIGPDRLLPGTGVAAGTDTIELTRHALSTGVTRVVMLPPFYYKNVSDDGLFAAYARIIEGVGDDRLKIILYHIPPMSSTPLGRGLVRRLREAFPNTVIGIKDSSGDLANMQEMVKENPGLAVLSGADPLLLPMLKSGGAGCITAATNFIAPQMRFIFDSWADAAKAAEVEAAQATVVAYRTLSTTYMQLPTVKAIIALKTGDMTWNRLVPPLMPLSEAQFEDIRTKLAALP
jgi:4-hydroxy-tetrahydrodipicolinate synthase